MAIHTTVTATFAAGAKAPSPDAERVRTTVDTPFAIAAPAVLATPGVEVPAVVDAPATNIPAVANVVFATDTPAVFVVMTVLMLWIIF